MDNVTTWLLGVLLGAIGGAAGTFIAHRTTIALMKRDIRDVEQTSKQMREDVQERLNRIERKQLVALQLMADIARAVNVDQRKFSDALVRMLTDSDEISERL